MIISISAFLIDIRVTLKKRALSCRCRCRCTLLVAPKNEVMIHQGTALVESQGVLIAECGPGEFLGEARLGKKGAIKKGPDSFGP